MASWPVALLRRTFMQLGYSSLSRGMASMPGAQPCYSTLRTVPTCGSVFPHQALRQFAHNKHTPSSSSIPQLPIWGSSSHPVARRGLRRQVSVVGRRLAGVFTLAAAGINTAACAPDAGSLATFVEKADHSWVTQLAADPDTDARKPNKASREVKSGHYVRVAPDPLPQPDLVIYSDAMAASLGLSDAVQTQEFLRFFSGDTATVSAQMETWATPYALSIMGQPQYQNCPFGNGNGYGDGRAISVGEVVVEGHRWEMQLKGGGRTPFCRGGDGRAVLRSSIREFLASEAMWALGIDTTRALSLIVSRKETSQRPWYREITIDDPVLKSYSLEERMEILSQPRNPDIMLNEPCAITTRVAPSFLRVGHLDLFARRAAKGGATAKDKQQLEALVEHCIFREFPDVGGPEGGVALAERSEAMLLDSGGRMAKMVAGWLSVGFCQGNFNSDNCLVAGRTMDYGPFGWMDAYDPLFAKWVGSGQHYAFMNQPKATLANFETLAKAVGEVMGPGKDNKVHEIVKKTSEEIDRAVANVWRSKLGFKAPGQQELAGKLFNKLQKIMRASKVDWTVFWRQLGVVAALPPSASAKELFAPLERAFYDTPSAGATQQWHDWLLQWSQAMDAEGERGGAKERMDQANPKYVPREWMLVQAYEMAAKGDRSMISLLHTLFKTPYAEHMDYDAQFYGTAPPTALLRGGTAFMS